MMPGVAAKSSRIVVQPSDTMHWSATLSGGPFSQIDINQALDAVRHAYQQWKLNYNIEKARAAASSGAVEETKND